MESDFFVYTEKITLVATNLANQSKKSKITQEQTNWREVIQALWHLEKPVMHSSVSNKLPVPSAICIAGSHACWLWNTLTAEQL